MGRDNGDTKRTGRYKLGTLLTGQLQRSAATQAAITAMIAKYAITTLNAATFGFLASNSFDNDCNITATLKVLTSANNPWVAGDVGKTIYVQGAGTAGATLVTTIASFGSAGSITLTDAAGTTVAASSTSASGLAVWGTTFAAEFYLQRNLNAAGDAEELRGTVTTPAETNITNIRVVGPGGDAGYTPCDDVVCSIGGNYYTVASDDQTIVLTQSASQKNLTVVMPTGVQTNGREITISRWGGDGKRFVATKFPSSNCQRATDTSVNASAGVGELFTSSMFSITYKYDATLAVWMRKSYYSEFPMEFDDQGSTYTTESPIIAHAGGGSASAVLLDAQYPHHRVTTCATAGDSIKLPPMSSTPDGGGTSYWLYGRVHYITNAGAAACQVFGSTSSQTATVDKINGIAGTVGVSIPAGTTALFIAAKVTSSNEEWYAILIPATFDPASPGAIGGTTPAAVSGTRFLPTPAVLTDAASITTNAALANLFRITLTADAHNFAAPTNPTDGQIVTYEIIQGGAGAYTVTWNGVFDWTTSVPAPTLSTAVAKHDFVSFRYIGALAVWRAVAVNLDD